MASRKLSDLDPKVSVMCEAFLNLCAQNDLDVVITCTYRSQAEQDALYAQGRTAPGKIVTRARGGQSKHNAVNAVGQPASLAFDIVLMDNGKCCWDTKDPRWTKLGELGEQVGLEWAGRWKTFKEFPHFQMKGDE